ncbi:hypothetical protein [Candidatus Hakubella thermalkaliphila]|uniref:hypothetical protein n=1 Tax=Candidatus Hakubella thermalkaliphila TaxID=2754717 RepID=UPI001594CE81|nr:hypothetical protein [Candidatus Hakubella thermalkaliphila]
MWKLICPHPVESWRQCAVLAGVGFMGIMALFTPEFVKKVKIWLFMQELDA